MRPTKKNKLQPCPFCESFHPTLRHDGAYWVDCERCNCSGPTSVKKSIAVQLWNMADRQDWHYCDGCQKERGGKVPKGPNCNTVMEGKCTRCKYVKTLVPNADYIWSGKAYVWD